MNFRQQLSFYKFWFLLSSDLPSIALTAFDEWYESINFAALIWMNKYNNSFELESYFIDWLKDIKIELPTNKDAFNIILRYYLLWIKNNEINFDVWFDFIYIKLIWRYQSIFWDQWEVVYGNSGLSKLMWHYIDYTVLDEDIYDIQMGLSHKSWVKYKLLKKKSKEIIMKELDVCLEKL